MSIPLYSTIDASDLDRTVWRYLTFSKYVSLLTYQAIWFSKLNILVDEFEGAMPSPVDALMTEEHLKLRSVLPAELHDQLHTMNAKNVADGKELTVVNCWLLAEEESPAMWREYAGDEGVAIKSTVRLLSENISCDPGRSHIGKVRYVDLSTHVMNAYEASQAHHRAFLKRLEFGGEKELRIATMSLRGPMCVGMDGVPLTPADYNGIGMNNFKYPGLYIRANLPKLITGTVLSPNASAWFELLVKRMVSLSKVGAPVMRSSLDN